MDCVLFGNKPGCNADFTDRQKVHQGPPWDCVSENFMGHSRRKDWMLLSVVHEVSETKTYWWTFSVPLNPFPLNYLWFLNCFCSAFLEPWCYTANQLAFPPVLSRRITIKDASTEGVAQCITDVNSSSKLVFCTTIICFYPKNKHGPTVNNNKTNGGITRRHVSTGAAASKALQAKQLMCLWRRAAKC